MLQCRDRGRFRTLNGNKLPGPFLTHRTDALFGQGEDHICVITDACLHKGKVAFKRLSTLDPTASIGWRGIVLLKGGRLLSIEISHVNLRELPITSPQRQRNPNSECTSRTSVYILVQDYAAALREMIAKVTRVLELPPFSDTAAIQNTMGGRPDDVVHSLNTKFGIWCLLC